MSRLGASLIALALLSLLAAPAAAQEGGQPVVEIQVQGLRTLSEETVRFYLGLEEGRLIDPARLSHNIHRLWETRLIDDLQIEEEAVPGGVRLVVVVEERPSLRSLEYEGLRRVSRSEVNERVTRDDIRVREGDPLSMGEIHRLKAAIEDLYLEKGYRFADVRVEEETAAPGERIVRMRIDEGDRVRIGGIEFEGNNVFGDHRLRWAMRQTKVTAFVPQLLGWDIYNPAKLEEDLGRVRDLYRERGYKNAAVGEPETEIRSVTPLVPMGPGGDEQRRLFLTIPVDEGERWQMGEIEIRGAEVFPADRLRRAFNRPRRGWLQASVIDDGVEAIGEIYRNNGYIHSRVDTELREREGNVADVIVNIVENDQFRVGRIEFRGNTRTQDRVLRRELRVHEGFVLNMGALRSSLFRINQLGYFELDEDDPVGFDVDTESKTVDLVVRGSEADRTEIMVGGGWSERDGLFGQLSLRTQNFLGRGESAGVSFQSGRFRTAFNLSYQIPWFRDRPQTIGFQVFRLEDDFPLLGFQEFRSKQRGGSLLYGRNLGIFTSLNFTARHALQDSTFLLPVPDGELQPFEQELEINSLQSMFVYDSRDSRFEPTRGQRFSASIEYAGGILGGTEFFVRPEVAFSFYRPVSGGAVPTVLGLHAEGGWVRPFGDRDLFFNNRYILGGEQSIRGHRWRSLFARNRDDEFILDQRGFPLGGNKFIQANVEYHFLLGGPFRILGFVDAANVFAEGHSIDPSRLRYTAGVELRLTVPMFGAPLRFIYSTNLTPLPGDRFESFQFSIGSTF